MEYLVIYNLINIPYFVIHSHINVEYLAMYSYINIAYEISCYIQHWTVQKIALSVSVK